MMHARHPRARRGRGGVQWNPARGIWQHLGDLGQSWCDTASAWNPLAYVFCLPSDVTRVYSAATANFPAPPPAQPPGAPQTVTQMEVPGAYTPLDSAIASHDASLSVWNQFFQTLPGTSAADNLAPPSVPTWVWIAGAAALGFVFLSGGRRR